MYLQSGEKKSRFTTKKIVSLHCKIEKNSITQFKTEGNHYELVSIFKMFST